MLHKDSVVSDGIHIIQAWQVADAAALAALVPVLADIGKVAYQVDTKKFWVLENNVGPVWRKINITDTADLTEGTSLYFTTARVLATVLAGLSTASGTIVTAGHTILQAMGFLQKQVSDNTTNIASNTTSIATLNSHLKEFLPIAAGDETTAIAVGTKVTFTSPPYAMTMNQVTANLTTVQTSGTIFTADVKLAGVSLFSTLPTIDNTEKSTATAATASVLSTTAIPANSEMTVAVTQIGDGTAKGLKVNLIWTKT